MTEGHVKYSRGYHWILRDAAVFETGIKGFEIVTEFVSLDRSGRLYLRNGYATDGITGVTGWPWEKLLARPWLRYASFGHDGLYQLIRLKLLPEIYRLTADELLRVWSIEAGAWRWQADAVYQMVDKLGASAVFPSAEPPILVAP